MLITLQIIFIETSNSMCMNIYICDIIIYISYRGTWTNILNLVAMFVFSY